MPMALSWLSPQCPHPALPSDAVLQQRLDARRRHRRPAERSPCNLPVATCSAHEVKRNAGIFLRVYPGLRYAASGLRLLSPSNRPQLLLSSSEPPRSIPDRPWGRFAPADRASKRLRVVTLLLRHGVQETQARPQGRLERPRGTVRRRPVGSLPAPDNRLQPHSQTVAPLHDARCRSAKPLGSLGSRPDPAETHLGAGQSTRGIA